MNTNQTEKPQVVGRIAHHINGEAVRVTLTAAGLSLPDGALLYDGPAVQGDLMLHGFRVMHLVGRPGVREGERWEIYAPCGSGGVVHEDDVTDWVVRKLLDALAAPQPAEQPPAPDVAGLVEALHEYKAECEKLRKDAERYRWLREQCGSSGLLTIAKVGAFELKAWSGDDPDDAIDAAMQGDQP